MFFHGDDNEIEIYKNEIVANVCFCNFYFIISNLIISHDHFSKRTMNKFKTYTSRGIHVRFPINDFSADVFVLTSNFITSCFLFHQISILWFYWMLKSFFICDQFFFSWSISISDSKKFEFQNLFFYLNVLARFCKMKWTDCNFEKYSSIRKKYLIWLNHNIDASS